MNSRIHVGPAPWLDRRELTVISGGQTGADRTALETARALGIRTGGWVPAGWRTEKGKDPSLAEFGCILHDDWRYPPRTYANVRDSDFTVWFGRNDNRGFGCTKNACLALGKKLLANPSSLELRDYLMLTTMHLPPIVNVAGTRLSLNAKIVDIVSTTLKPVLVEMLVAYRRLEQSR